MFIERTLITINNHPLSTLLPKCNDNRDMFEYGYTWGSSIF
jgi:hypothetical protein